MYQSHIPKHFLMLNMTIHVNKLMKCSISIKFKFRIQFVTFLRGHPGTPIDPATVLVALCISAPNAEVGCEALSSVAQDLVHEHQLSLAKNAHTLCNGSLMVDEQRRTSCCRWCCPHHLYFYPFPEPSGEKVFKLVEHL